MLEFFAENPVAAVIVACEVGLWVLLGAGMVLRYLLRLGSPAPPSSPAFRCWTPCW